MFICESVLLNFSEKRHFIVDMQFVLMKNFVSGFKFNQATVPTTFSFSNSNNSPFAFGR